MRKEGLAVQCLFSIRLLSLGRQLLSQLLPESPWQHLPLWAGRKTMPNIRKKQNHCLHMSRDCPPLVCLLWSMIANLCKTIPVAKEEGALERNILVRAQNKRRAVLGQAFYSYSLPRSHSLILKNQNGDPSPTQTTTGYTEMDAVCSSPTVVTGYGSHFEKVDGTITINRSQPKIVIASANYWRAFCIYPGIHLKRYIKVVWRENQQDSESQLNI